ncbi:hypothetical protein WR25_04415 [Diploscapter pachys]|uniref:V-SNARE coiled-coil homology domain-containing protein n=1 Tax=Diploscapter pachys TaxID=2018661 RepID=A0A2A2J868_9BILA|nr:hypothetical protein WR25_04415 [Diploscapter pachys]
MSFFSFPLIGEKQQHYARGKKQMQRQNRADDLRAEIHGVAEVMRNNLQMIAERSNRLEELKQRAERLTMSTEEFEKGAVQMRRKQSASYRISLIFLVLLCVILVVVAFC